MPTRCTCRTAWNDLGKMTQQEAMQKYAETVDKFVPGWDKSTVRSPIPLCIVHFPPCLLGMPRSSCSAL